MNVMFREKQKHYIPAEWICNFISLAPCIVLQLADSGSRLNTKTVFPRYGDFYVQDKTVGETVLSLTRESLY